MSNQEERVDVRPMRSDIRPKRLRKWLMTVVHLNPYMT
jgi:hypothetical protein